MAARVRGVDRQQLNLLLVASSGGHLAHLMWLRPWWSQHNRVWATFDTPDARSRLSGERVWWCAHPTQRSVVALAKNAAVARRCLTKERPDLVVSTGAGVAVPFFALAHRRGVPSIYLEVIDRVDGPSLSMRLCAPFATRLVLQWPGQGIGVDSEVLMGPMR